LCWSDIEEEENLASGTSKYLSNKNGTQVHHVHMAIR